MVKTRDVLYFNIITDSLFTTVITVSFGKGMCYKMASTDVE